MWIQRIQNTKYKHVPQIPTQILREMTKELRKEIYKTQYNLSGNVCKNCPHKKTCITAKSDKYKRITVTKNIEINKEQKEFEQIEHFKQRYCHRSIIEGKTADLKGNYWLNRIRDTGLFPIKFQFFLRLLCKRGEIYKVSDCIKRKYPLFLMFFIVFVQIHFLF